MMRTGFFRMITAATLITAISLNGCGLVDSIKDSIPSQFPSQATVSEPSSESESEKFQEIKAPALIVGDKEVSVSEALLYMYLMQNSVEEIFGKDIMQNEYPKGGSFEDYIRSETEKQIIELTIMSELAQESGISLSDEDEAMIDERISILLEDAPELGEKGINEMVARSVYQTSMLAGKYYDETTADYELSLSDEEKEDCKVIKVRQIFIANGDKSHLPEGQSVKKFIRSVYNNVNSGEDFDTWADSCSSAGAQDVIVLNRNGYCFDTDAQLDESFTEAAWKLSDGEITEPFKTAYGWHILKRDASEDEELENAAMEASFDKKRRTFFNEIYQKKLSETVVTEADGWETVNLLK